MRPKKLTKRIDLVASEEELNIIDYIADKRGVSRSALIRWSLRQLPDWQEAMGQIATNDVCATTGNH